MTAVTRVTAAGPSRIPRDGSALLMGFQLDMEVAVTGNVTVLSVEGTEKAKAAATLRQPDARPDDWVAAFLLLRGITYDYKTDSVRQGGDLIDHVTLIAQMRVTAFRFGVTAIKAYLPDAVLLWKRKQSQDFLDSVRGRLAHARAETDHIAAWVAAATGQVSHLDVAVVRHLVWQVKRKLSGLPVEHHMMPILYGRTGGGKSVAVHKLLEPVRDVTLCRDMGVFGDAFGRRQFARSYVMFFDELSKASAVDVNALKNIISAPTVEWRVMRSEGVASSPQNSTFIGCSNDPVSERINDPTSARRFWQINCAEKLDWEAINAIDYLALWKSVDERSPCMLVPYLSEIQAIQHRELRAKDIIEQWLELACEPAPFDTASPTTNELFEQFMAWCRWQGAVSHPGLQKFSRGLESRMRGMGWGIESKHASRGTVWSLRMRSVGTSQGIELQP